MLTEYHRKRIESKEAKIESIHEDIRDYLLYIKTTFKRLETENMSVFDKELLLMQIGQARGEVSALRRDIKQLEREINREFKASGIG